MKQPKDFQCLECGKYLTLKQAERAMYGDKGCPKCGGTDIDAAANHPQPSFLDLAPEEMIQKYSLA